MQKMYLDSTVNRIGPGRPYRANETWVPDAWYDRLAGEELIRRARAEVKADQAGNLFLEESENADGSGATVTATAAVTANSTTEIPWTSLTKQYYRLRYVNGATPHTTSPYLFMESSGRPLTDTQVTGSSAPQLQVVTNQVVGAGASFFAPFEDLSPYTWVAAVAIAEVSHSFKLGVDGSPTSGGTAVGMVSSTVTAASAHTDGRLKLNYARTSILNSDVASHTYNVWRRAFVGV